MHVHDFIPCVLSVPFSMNCSSSAQGKSHIRSNSDRETILVVSLPKNLATLTSQLLKLLRKKFITRPQGIHSDTSTDCRMQGGVDFHMCMLVYEAAQLCVPLAPVSRHSCMCPWASLDPVKAVLHKHHVPMEHCLQATVSSVEESSEQGRLHKFD